MMEIIRAKNEDTLLDGNKQMKIYSYLSINNTSFKSITSFSQTERIYI